MKKKHLIILPFLVALGIGVYDLWLKWREEGYLEIKDIPAWNIATIIGLFL